MLTFSKPESEMGTPDFFVNPAFIEVVSPNVTEDGTLVAEIGFNSGCSLVVRDDHRNASSRVRDWLNGRRGSGSAYEREAI